MCWLTLVDFFFLTWWSRRKKNWKKLSQNIELSSFIAGSDAARRSNICTWKKKKRKLPKKWNRMATPLDTGECLKINQSCIFKNILFIFWEKWKIIKDKNAYGCQELITVNLISIRMFLVPGDNKNKSNVNGQKETFYFITYDSLRNEGLINSRFFYFFD